MSRRLARKKAFLCIYQFEFNKDFDIDTEYNSIMEFDDEEITLGENLSDNDKTFLMHEISGTIQNLEEIDKIISENANKWTFERLNKIDVAILRLAIYEILFMEDIPKSVSVNEAVELAKEFGSDDSFSFVNGLLRKVG